MACRGDNLFTYLYASNVSLNFKNLKNTYLNIKVNA
jgi:hypothetical protein